MKLSVKLKRSIKVPTSILEKEDLQLVGEAACDAVRLRVRKYGLDVDDQFMGHYTAAYAKRKARLGGQSSYRDLTLTRKFLNELRPFRATKKRVFIGFTTTYGQTLSKAHTKRHRFLGIAKTDWPYVMERLADILAARIKKLKYTG